MSDAFNLQTLPSLLTECVIVGHARKADVIFTPRQFVALCIHMLNENPLSFFLKPYRDNDGQAKYAKANPFRADAKKQIAWAWDTVTGKAKSTGSVGFYPTNEKRESRWAAIDFDAHDGDTLRARDLALKAFRILYEQPQLFVCLATSAGDEEHTGFHLFVFSRDFHSCEDWTRLLKQVCAQIGAEIRPGICEKYSRTNSAVHGVLVRRYERRGPGTQKPVTAV